MYEQLLKKPAADILSCPVFSAVKIELILSYSELITCNIDE